MICLGVFELDDNKRRQIRDVIACYTIQRNCELDVMWFSKESSAALIKKYAHKIQIAFISLNNEMGEGIARELYTYNKDSLIVFYKDSPCHIEPLLESRPKAFHLWKYGQEALKDKLDIVLKELSESYKIFRYQTKRMIYMYPQSNIKYFQSDLKYVIIHKLGKDNAEHIYAKLSDIENNLDRRFLRIHKSFIVNTAFIERIDKKNHTVYLRDGEELPISDMQYKRVIEFMDKCSE